MNDLTTKYCPDCKSDLPRTDFYKTKYSLTRVCKKCHNKIRNTHFRKERGKKPTGVKKLPPVIQWSIRRDVAEGQNFKHISRFYHIQYQTILRWNRQGQFKIPALD
jgi:hypothetical protein